MRQWVAPIVLALLVQSAAAATTPNVSINPQTPKIVTTHFVQGTDAAGTYKTIYTGGANGSKILGIWVTTTDGTASHLVTVAMSSSTSSHCGTMATSTTCAPGAAVTVALNSGFAASTPAVNLLSQTNWPGLPLDSEQNPFLFLSDNTQTIELTFATALTASTKLSVTVIAADF